MSKPTLLVPGKIQAVGSNVNERPIDYILKTFKFNLQETHPQMKNRVFILNSETASGKSTVLPVNLFYSLKGKENVYRGKDVVLTEPRILTAKENAIEIDFKKSPWNKDIILGQNVGYQTSVLKNLPKHGIIFMTIGILQAQLNTWKDSEIMARYQYIVIDEAHERSVEADMTLMKLKNFYNRNIGNKELPMLVLASATIDTELYRLYFNLPKENVIRVIGSSFEKSIVWAKRDTNNFTTAISNIIPHLKVGKSGQSDILAFLPSLSEMKIVEGKINSTTLNPDSVVISIERESVRTDNWSYQMLKRPYGHWYKYDNDGQKVSVERRIILANVVMETGITVDTLLYVIDSGWERRAEFYPIENISSLMNKPAPKSRVEQRKGRIGRKFAGFFYPTYTKETYDLLPQQQLPDILYENNGGTLLELYKEQQDEFRVDRINLIDPPTADSLIATLEKAVVLGFISRDTLHLTSMGKIACKLNRLSLEQSRMLLAGYIWGASIQDLITMLAMTHMKTFSFTDDPVAFITLIYSGMPAIFHTSTSIDPYYIFILRMIFCDQLLECIFVFNIFKHLCLQKPNGSLIDICNEHSINLNWITEFIKVRDEIMIQVIQAGLDPLENHDKSLDIASQTNILSIITNLKRCIYDGYRLNLIKLEDKTGKYHNRYGRQIQIANELWFSQTDIGLATKAGATTIKPKYMVCDQFRLKNVKVKDDNGKKTTLITCKIVPNFLSVLDGYVEPDDFTLPNKNE
ncbi:DEAD/DEAH box helicase [uncultured archaeon]|nr:DEAD/DEAH box helicase [uncultured archaeon]